MNLWQMHQENPDNDVGAKIKTLVRKCEKQSSFTMSSPILYIQDTSTASLWLVAEAFFWMYQLIFSLLWPKYLAQFYLKREGLFWLLFWGYSLGSIAVETIGLIIPLSWSQEMRDGAQLCLLLIQSSAQPTGLHNHSKGRSFCLH